MFVLERERQRERWKEREGEKWIEMEKAWSRGRGDGDLICFAESQGIFVVTWQVKASLSLSLSPPPASIASSQETQIRSYSAHAISTQRPLCHGIIHVVLPWSHLHYPFTQDPPPLSQPLLRADQSQ